MLVQWHFRLPERHGCGGSNAEFRIHAAAHTNMLCYINSYKRVKGRSHTVEKRYINHSHDHYHCHCAGAGAIAAILWHSIPGCVVRYPVALTCRVHHAEQPERSTYLTLSVI